MNYIITKSFSRIIGSRWVDDDYDSHADKKRVHRAARHMAKQWLNQSIGEILHEEEGHDGLWRRAHEPRLSARDLD